jgi:TolB-like protein/Tfp pilus assembly protein PilF
MRGRGFWQELKRRHVYRVAVAYAVVGWLLIQIATQVFPIFHMPDWTAQLVVLLILVGFPIALVLAWAFDVTPAGIQRTDKEGQPVLRRARHGTLSIALLGVLVAILAGFGYWWWLRPGPSAQAATAGAAPSTSALTSTVARKTPVAIAASSTVSSRSIAVLPFDNESGDKSQQFFSDGLSEDLITALSQFKGLKVINSDSSFRFRNSSQSVSAIAIQLGVAHLLEGGVQRLGDEVRIRAELVNADDGSTLWSQHYDRPYRDLFKLQDDITHAVADAMKAKLLGHAAENDRPPSGNLDAYAAYLKGRAQPYTPAGQRQAIALFTKATQIDPDYAQSYAVMAITWMNTAAVFSYNDAEARQAEQKARTAADTALRLDPDLAAAHFARAFILLNADLDWQGALDEADKVVALAANKVNGMDIKAQVLTALGRAGEAEDLIRKVSALNPLNAGEYENLALILRVGRLDQAQAALHKAIELAPGSSRLHANLTLVELLRGDHAAAVAAANAEPPGFWHDFAQAAVLQTDPGRGAADDALKSMVKQYADTGAYQIAELYALRKNPDGMFRWLDRAWTNHDAGIQHLLTDPLILRYRDDPRFAAYCRKVGLPVPAIGTDQPATSIRMPPTRRPMYTVWT